MPASLRHALALPRSIAGCPVAVLLLAVMGPGCSSGRNASGGGGVAGLGGGGGENAGGQGGGEGDAIPTGPPDIVIVLDRSSSMNDGLDGTTCAGGCGARSRWSLLTAELGRALSSADTRVHWGLKLFASNRTCDVAAGVDLAPQPGNAPAIIAKLALVSATTSTPTTVAVSTTAAYLSTLADGAPKFMVLITDGAPNCGSAPCAPAVGDMTNQCDDANAIAAVEQAYLGSGIPTFVLGVGALSGPAEGTLMDLALKGGVATTTPPFYYPVLSGDDLSAAFSAIVALAAR